MYVLENLTQKMIHPPTNAILAIFDLAGLERGWGRITVRVDSWCVCSVCVQCVCAVFVGVCVYMYVRACR